MQTNSIPYTFIRGGYFYFSRRIPVDLNNHYSANRIVVALHTSCPKQARAQSKIAASKLDAYWAKLRLSTTDVMFDNLLQNDVNNKDSLEACKSAPQPNLSNALNIYLSLKGKGRPKTFEAAANRACKYVIELAGDKPLGSYSRADALKLRDWLVCKGLTGSSVTRNFSYVKAVFNFAAAEYALEVKNPFVGVYHDRKNGVVKREAVPDGVIVKIQTECRKIDDDLRWLIALISDTGMRLAEGAGLLKSDIHLNQEFPFVRLQPHPWRNLKTDASIRDIPLVGEALWACNRIMQADTKSNFAFPRYNRGNTTSANSASASLNKWLKQHMTNNCTIHSFRHSMRDRLRNVGCPAEVIDQLGGWQTSGVGHSYGHGFNLETLHLWMNTITTKN